MESFLNNLYSRFFLRDFMGYMLSGSLLEYYLIIAFNQFHICLEEITFIPLVAFLCIGYLFGIMISSFSLSIALIISKIKIISYAILKVKSNSYSDPDDDLVKILRINNERLLAQRDRFVSLKEITEKNGYSILICFIIDKYWNIHLMGLYFLIPIIVLISIYMYYKSKQRRFEKIILDNFKN